MKHVSSHTLERYLLGLVRGAKVARVRQHLMICGDCRRHSGQIKEFLSVIERALAESKGHIELHATSEGIVSLRAHEAIEGWLARIRGADIDSGALVKARDEAVSLCRARFAEMFPEHECNSECRVFSSELPGIRRRCSKRALRG